MLADESLGMDFVTEIKQKLRCSVRDLSQWKLYNSSKWSAEALNGFIRTLEDDTSNDNNTGNADNTSYANTHSSIPRMTKNDSPLRLKIPLSSDEQDSSENIFKSTTRSNAGPLYMDPMMGLSEEEYDTYLFASTLFDCKEFDRCSFYLKDVKEPRLKFLKLYTDFLIWDKKYMEATENILMTGRLDKRIINNLGKQDSSNGDPNRMDGQILDMFNDGSQNNKSLNNNTILSETGHQTSLSLLLSELREYMDKYIKPLLSDSIDAIPDTTKLGVALLYYLKGVILTRQGNKSIAITALLNSLSYYSYNWSCWSELLNCISRFDEAQLLLNYIEKKFVIRQSNETSQLIINSDLMVDFFKLAIYQEFYSSSVDLSVSSNTTTTNNTTSFNLKNQTTPQLNRRNNSNNYNQNGISTNASANDNNNNNSSSINNNIDEFFRILEYLLIIMPNFLFLKSMNAMISYNYMDYVNAEIIFDDIVKHDPYRLEDLDIYSNILYVMQKYSKLTYLAQFVSQLDRFRPETCCIVANYYSARQEHEKSIMYFRRALILDKKSTSAWTLMGHEFVELKNSHAAIECYRRAVDINERDYKAWYGLGQAYEVLDMHLYSLYYFQKACTLKPLDRRMWQAVADCYAVLKDATQAIKCYQRAYQLSSNPGQDALLLYRLAKQYEQMMDIDNCKTTMLKCIAIEDNSSGELVTDETIKARLWLAQHEMKMKNYEAAYNHAVNITNGTSEEIEEARNIARNCRIILK